jgi:hypothetical protein
MREFAKRAQTVGNVLPSEAPRGAERGVIEKIVGSYSARFRTRLSERVTFVFRFSALPEAAA